MIKSNLLGLAAILSAAIATPALAAGETATRHGRSKRSPTGTKQSLVQSPVYAREHLSALWTGAATHDKKRSVSSVKEESFQLP